jgi:hypothetical protein
MAILSSLFGAQQQQPAVGAQPIAGAEIPAELKPYYTDILSKAQALYDKRTEEGFVPYEGPTIAQFTPEQEQAFTGIAGLQGQVAPKFAEAERITKEAIAPITGEQIQEAMSPYQQAVVDIEKREAQKAFEQNVLPKVRQAQVAAGAFGGTRGTLLEAQSLADQARLLSDIQTRGSQAAFQDARAALDAQRTREGQGATQLANIAPQALRTGLAELGAQQSVGEARQAQSQTALDEAYRQFLQEREQPYTDMQKYQAVVTGAPLTTTQFAPPPPPQPSLGQQLIGGLAGIGSLYGTFTGKPILGGQAKTGGGIAGLVKRQTGNQIGFPSNYQPMDTSRLGYDPSDPYGSFGRSIEGITGAIKSRQEAQKRTADILGQRLAREKERMDTRDMRSAADFESKALRELSKQILRTDASIPERIVGFADVTAEEKKKQKEQKRKDITEFEDLQLKINDAISKGDLETAQALMTAAEKGATLEVAKQTAAAKKAAAGVVDTGGAINLDFTAKTIGAALNKDAQEILKSGASINIKDPTSNEVQTVSIDNIRDSAFKYAIDNIASHPQFKKVDDKALAMNLAADYIGKVMSYADQNNPIITSVSKPTPSALKSLQQIADEID